MSTYFKYGLALTAVGIGMVLFTLQSSHREPAPSKKVGRAFCMTPFGPKLFTSDEFPLKLENSTLIVNLPDGEIYLDLSSCYFQVSNE
jgi:hypothetical protein